MTLWISFSISKCSRIFEDKSHPGCLFLIFSNLGLEQVTHMANIESYVVEVLDTCDCEMWNSDKFLEINSLFLFQIDMRAISTWNPKKKLQTRLEVQSFEEVRETLRLKVSGFVCCSFAQGPLGWCPLVLTEGRFFFLFFMQWGFPCLLQKKNKTQDGLDLITLDWNNQL
jgi:hypothetical protein